MRLTDKGLLACQILRQTDRAYGLEIIAASGGKLKRGTVYVLLSRLADAGYVSSEQEIEVGRPGMPKRYWWLTEKGRRVLDAEVAARRAFDRSMRGAPGYCVEG